MVRGLWLFDRTSVYQKSVFRTFGAPGIMGTFLSNSHSSTLASIDFLDVISYATRTINLPAVSQRD